MPPSTTTDAVRREERQREKEVVKRRLLELTQRSPTAAAFVAENVRALNGRRGDPHSFDALDQLLREQSYRLAHWRVAADEIDVDDRRLLYLSMHCFWEGEARLGSIDGVLATRAGFIDGREVVEVTYDAGHVDAAHLVAAARQRGVTGDVWEAGAVPFREAPRSDQKRHLSGTRWEKLPGLSPLQAARINSGFGSGSPGFKPGKPCQRLFSALESSSLVNFSPAASLANSSPAMASEGIRFGSKRATASVN